LPSAVIRYAEAEVPTEYGPVRTIVYRAGEGPAPEEHLALVVGEPAKLQDADDPPLVRVHSECWTGEVLRSHKCDCRDQLDQAMRAISDIGRGVVVYLRQEGRGIGLGNKVRAYALQQAGADTVDANRLLGFDDDARSYDIAAAILRDLGVRRVALLTNNPRKVQGLAEEGIEVVRRVPIKAEPNPHNAGYLSVKARKLGHAL
jgi:GTP cyclohydrolase II/3,4-dihydroxy 2-butanone 4-phosphate synthase/GTP cyclohydrolase II